MQGKPKPITNANVERGCKRNLGQCRAGATPLGALSKTDTLVVQRWQTVPDELDCHQRYGHVPVPFRPLHHAEHRRPGLVETRINHGNKVMYVAVEDRHSYEPDWSKQIGCSKALVASAIVARMVIAADDNEGGIFVDDSHLRQ